MINVFLNWHLGNTFGWGILGLNLFSHWANDGELRPLMGHRIMPDALAACDPLRIGRVYPAIDFSNRFLADVRAGSDGRKMIDAIVVDALGNDFAPSNCYGRRNIGRCIFEHPPTPQSAGRRA